MRTLLLAVLLLTGCEQPNTLLEKQKDELKSKPVVQEPVTPPKPEPSKPIGSPAEEVDVRPAPGPVTCVYYLGGQTWCFPCRQHHPYMVSAFKEMQNRGYIVRWVGHDVPRPAHFIELDSPMDAADNPSVRSPEESRIAASAGGYNHLVFPCYYAVDANWNIIRTWSPSDGPTRPWAGVPTLLWLLKGK